VGRRVAVSWQRGLKAPTQTPEMFDIASMTPAQARRLAAAQYEAGMKSDNGVNVPRAKARAYEEDAVDVLYGLMTDFSVDPSVRRGCANDIITLSRGKVPTMDMSEIDEVGRSLLEGAAAEQALAEARERASQFQAIDQFVGKRPYEEWPEWLRAKVKPAGNGRFALVAPVDGQNLNANASGSDGESG